MIAIKIFSFREFRVKVFRIKNETIGKWWVIPLTLVISGKQSERAWWWNRGIGWCQRVTGRTVAVVACSSGGGREALALLWWFCYLLKFLKISISGFCRGFEEKNFALCLKRLKQWKGHRSKLGLKEKLRMALEYSKKTKKKGLNKPVALELVFTLIFNWNLGTKIGIK